jgi:hypothetical protein
LAAVYNAGFRKDHCAAYERTTCGTRAEFNFKMIAEGGFLMLDPVGQEVLCG